MMDTAVVHICTLLFAMLTFIFYCIQFSLPPLALKLFAFLSHFLTEFCLVFLFPSGQGQAR